jgi:hypothetical protein
MRDVRGAMGYPFLHLLDNMVPVATFLRLVQLEGVSLFHHTYYSIICVMK